MAAGKGQPASEISVGENILDYRNFTDGQFSAEQQVYGSLDRGLLRRSRGRKRPELLNCDLSGDRDRSAPQPTVEEANKPLDPKTKDIKKRVESWLKDSEEDVHKADEYLDKKKEIKATRGSSSDLKSEFIVII